MGLTEKLKQNGITLPAVAAPVGAYVPAVRTGRYIYTSGQLPLVEGSLQYRGKVGQDVTLEEGYDAARICILNALAAAASVVDNPDDILRVVKVTGFVNSATDFTAHAGVVNGASELLGKLFVDAHARAAVGVAALPLDAAVEVEIILEVTG
jgi:enamine deaminase RidA (YjgF/YER057c/UK114 family)